MSKQEIIDEIRRIIGSKKFTFSEAYVKKCKTYPKIGEGDRPYTAVTKKYVYCYCYAVYSRKDNGVEEWGYSIQRFPVCGFCKSYVMDKIELEDLFTEDLQKILNDIRFYLWWETNVRIPKLKAELADASKYIPIYQRMMANHDVSEENEAQTYGKMALVLSTKIEYK